jgi:hypothetical protein
LDLRSVQDWIVGGVSMLIGVAFCYSAIVDSQFRERLKLTRFIAEKFGPSAARALCAFVGLLLIALGIAIACGYSLELIGKSLRPTPHGPFHA